MSFYSLQEVDKRIFVRSLFDRIHMLGSLTERFKSEYYIAFPLAGILSSEVFLFADKSLRTLAQRTELFFPYLYGLTRGHRLKKFFWHTLLYSP